MFRVFTECHFLESRRFLPFLKRAERPHPFFSGGVPMASFRHYDFRTFFLSDVFSLFLLFFIFPPFFSFSPFSGTAQAQVKAETQEEAMISAGPRGSQNAVKLGLDWLIRHQLPDGSWSFSLGDVEGCDCENSCTETAAKDRQYATALGLLPFLGCGRNACTPL